MPTTVHTLPVNDVIAHEPSEDCACQPIVQPVKDEDGTMNWQIIHNAWDGRQ
jgi:hypothetical protein